MAKVHKPLSDEDKALLGEYLASLQMHPNNTPRLFGIGFLGLPGSGKSTLADAIGKRLDLPVNRSDQIRRYLNRKGFAGAHPRPDIMAPLAEGRTRHYYENNTSVVIDANFTEYAAASRATALQYGAELLLVKVECPDEVAMQRLRKRAESSETGESAATADDYARIKTLVATFDVVDDPYAEIDTTADVDDQISQLVEKMCADGFIAAELIAA